MGWQSPRFRSGESKLHDLLLLLYITSTQLVGPERFGGTSNQEQNRTSGVIDWFNLHGLC